MNELVQAGQILRRIKLRQSGKNADDAIGFYERMAVIVKGAKMKHNETRVANLMIKNTMDKYAFAEVIEYLPMEEFETRGGRRGKRGGGEFD